MILKASLVIYLYMIACTVLMVFNFSYIIYNNRKKKDTHKASTWNAEIRAQLGRIEEGLTVEPRHENLLSRRLVNTDSLIAYSQALELIKKDLPGPVAEYIRICYPSFQELAYKYGRRESMERAFFADFISRFPPYSGDEYIAILDILISYLDRSTVYCRENTLCALYSLGNTNSVVNALQIFNDRAYFHHQKLLADGLMTFVGDKNELAAALWEKYKSWNNNLMLSVVQFISSFSPDFKEMFLPVLHDQNADLELRLAVMRYYRRNPYEPARAVLVSFLEKRKTVSDELAIVAASVLDRYPGDDTVQALKQALGDPNWYIRNNAARSLTMLDTSDSDLLDVLDGDDKYAKEILIYNLEKEGRNIELEKAVPVYD